MKHLGTVELQTERLALRKFQAEDSNMVFENWGTDSKVNKYMSWELHKTVDDSKKQIESIIEQYARADYYKWAIVNKDNDEVIGWIGINYIARPKFANVAFLLSRKNWGKGYTTEAFERVLKFLFEEVGVNRVETFYHPDNLGSKRVMEKCRLKYEGLMRQAFNTNSDEYSDMIICSILADEYFKRKDV